MSTRSSLRLLLLQRLIGPITLILVAGALLTYFIALGPATEAYDQALLDVGLALGKRIEAGEEAVRFDLPAGAELVLRTDRFDAVYYRVRGPDGERLGGDDGLPDRPAGRVPRDGMLAYNALYRGEPLRVVELVLPCGARECTVQVAETTHKRERLLADILVSGVGPQLLLVTLTLAIIWFGVDRGLSPLARLSEQILERSPTDLKPIDESQAPAEARPIVSSLNQLFRKVGEASENQRRFIANAAHQLRTPLASLQAHAEIAMTQAAGDAAQSEMTLVRDESRRAARLATQLLALSRAEPGGKPPVLESLDLRRLFDAGADAWVRRASARGIDLGFDLAPAPTQGDPFLLGEALANMVANALEYAGTGRRVTLRCGVREGQAFFEVEDDGPGIPAAERERVFERFYRVPGSPGQGSGIGLAIVRETADAHGASVSVGASREGNGCRLTVMLPPARHAAA